VFGKILIANRGEIAVRIARTCRELGIRTVAVYSTEDHAGAVLGLADEAVCIGPGAPRRSYLNGAAILEAAMQTGADAIHPGYGFLSENPDFAEMCAAHDVAFIGPPASLIAELGDKARARAMMTEAGLPLLPGGVEALAGVDEARKLAGEIGYPVIVKAVAGGGGRGMAVVNRPEDLDGTFHRVRAQAQQLYGDGRCYVERYSSRARHVEVQVVGDLYGRVVSLGVRDCSVQRRHQKLIEETPAPGLPGELTAAMEAAAVRAAAEVGYPGAGTFEFLVEDGRYYFLEVNTRIQVEHPVTEMVTGVDIVAEQIKVAGGKPLDLDGVERRGAAIECRLTTEDPARNFLPTAGALTRFEPPGGPFVRVDTHAYPGYRVSPLYDSLLAKIVVWGPDRDTAIARMRRALAECHVEGVHTSGAFLRDVLDRPAFRNASHHTRMLEDGT
jgi:acetyl-CoA carboxylase, biotin carboxylase subunit